MSTFADEIAAVLATVPAGLPAQDPDDTAFGSDISCTDDCGPTFDELDQYDPDVVKQAFMRWLLTSPGELPDLHNTDWGGGLWLMLRRAMTPTEIATVPGRLISKWFHDDDRLTSLVIDPLVDVGDHTYQLNVRGITAAGPFSLVLAANVVGKMLKEIQNP